MSFTRPIQVLTLEAAKKLAEAAEAEARKRGWAVAVAVVSPEGSLILFHAIDGTQPGSTDIAVRKARTAARLRRPTKALEDGLAAGRHALLTIPGAVGLEGGVPVAIGGQVAGAIGVSGMTSVEDGVVAAAALAALGDR